MDFELIDSLIIVKMNNKKLVVDTGADASIALHESFTITINNHNYQLNKVNVSAAVVDTLDHLLEDNDIDGLIGCDIISKTNLSINYLKRKIDFGVVPAPYDIEQYTIPLKFEKGIAFTELSFKSNRLNLVLDTGSKIHYIKEKYLDKIDEGEFYTDYSIGLGHIEGHLYGIHDEIHGESTAAAILPRLFSQVCDGIISVYEFTRPGYCCFDFSKREFRFTRRFI